MTATDKVNQKAKKALDRLTGASIYILHTDRVRKLWEIRDMTVPTSKEELNRSFALLDKNYKDMKTIADRYPFF